MNSLDQLFSEKQNEIFNLFFTAGHPSINDVNTIIRSLQKTSVDIIEIGIPFSDPIADGTTIQKSSEIALRNGMNIEILFDKLRNVKSKIPLVIMSYYNPILKYGFENFCKLCFEHNISGLIIPDLPLHEYKILYKSIYKKYGLKFIPLVSPLTSEKRLKELCQESTGFIYAVGSNQTTGIAAADKETDLNLYSKRIRKYAENKKILSGFGIHNSTKFKNVCKYFDGGIIGSAFIEEINNKTESLDTIINQFCNNIKPTKNDYSAISSN